MKIKLCSLSLSPSLTGWLSVPRHHPFSAKKETAVYYPNICLPSLSPHLQMQRSLFYYYHLCHPSHSYLPLCHNHLLLLLPRGFRVLDSPHSTPLRSILLWYSRILTFGVFGLSFLRLIASLNRSKFCFFFSQFIWDSVFELCNC